jgi:hypothetical protein
MRLSIKVCGPPWSTLDVGGPLVGDDLELAGFDDVERGADDIGGVRLFLRASLPPMWITNDGALVRGALKRLGDG